MPEPKRKPQNRVKTVDESPRGANVLRRLLPRIGQIVGAFGFILEGGRALTGRFILPIHRRINPFITLAAFSFYVVSQYFLRRFATPAITYPQSTVGDDTTQKPKIKIVEKFTERDRVYESPEAKKLQGEASYREALHLCTQARYEEAQTLLSKIDMPHSFVACLNLQGLISFKKGDYALQESNKQNLLDNAKKQFETSLEQQSDRQQNVKYFLHFLNGEYKELYETLKSKLMNIQKKKGLGFQVNALTPYLFELFAQAALRYQPTQQTLRHWRAVCLYEYKIKEREIAGSETIDDLLRLVECIKAYDEWTSELLQLGHGNPGTKTPHFELNSSREGLKLVSLGQLSVTDLKGRRDYYFTEFRGMLDTMDAKLLTPALKASLEKAVGIESQSTEQQTTSANTPQF